MRLCAEAGIALPARTSAVFRSRRWLPTGAARC